MLKREKNYYLQHGGPADGHMASNTTPLEIGNRGDSNFAAIDIVNIAGDSFVQKKPNFPITPLARVGFNYFTSHLPEHPYLQQHFPETVIAEDPEKGPYFLQEFIKTKPGYANMTKSSQPGDKLSQQAHFDPEQITNPQDLVDLLAIMGDGLDFFNKSLKDPESGLDSDVGWLPEMNHPDSYVLGKLPGDSEDEIYFVDCHPILPVTKLEASNAVFHFYTAIDEIARTKFGIRLVDLLRGNGRATASPISLGQLAVLA